MSRAEITIGVTVHRGERTTAWDMIWRYLLGPEPAPAAPIVVIPAGGHSVQKRRRRATRTATTAATTPVPKRPRSARKAATSGA